MLDSAKNAVVAILFLAVSSVQAFAATETYYTDQGHTEVRFGWTHAGISQQTGEFLKAKGKLVLDPDNVERSTLSVTIDTNSPFDRLRSTRQTSQEQGLPRGRDLSRD